MCPLIPPGGPSWKVKLSCESVPSKLLICQVGYCFSSLKGSSDFKKNGKLKQKSETETNNF